MIVHELKIHELFARAYFSGQKRWEIRKNDRNFKVGDKINFTVINDKEETVASYMRSILYVFDKVEFGLQPGYVILSISAV